MMDVKKSTIRVAYFGIGSLLLLSAVSSTVRAQEVKVPRLVDLGAGKCIPCKKMKPILDELREEYRGRMEVIFIDVWVNPKQAKAYRIQTIPTQIFYDTAGKEQARHEGFISKEDILAQWKELGITFDPTESPVTTGPWVDQRYPGLASGSLTYARLGQLPNGLVLQAGEVKITDKELQKMFDGLPKNVRDQYRKNRFLLLEREAEQRLLLSLAKSEFIKSQTDCRGKTDEELVRKFIQNTVIAPIDISEAEVVDFSKKNKAICPTDTCGEISETMKEYALQDKQQKAITSYVRTLGRRIPVVLSALWVKAQAKLAMDNPVDKARASGKPSVVDFGAEGMTPILKTLRDKYAGKLNVLFVPVRQESALATRYGIQLVPIQVFFDNEGKEVYRHLGQLPQNEIETKLQDLGVK